MGMGLQRYRGHATGILATGIIGVSLLLGTNISTFADTAPGQAPASASNKVVDIDLANVPLQAAIQLIQQRTGINIVLINPSTKFSNVTLKLTGKPVDVVLRLLATASGADFWNEGGIYYFGPKGSAPKQPEPERILLPDPEPVAPKRKLITKLKLNFIDGHRLVKIIGAGKGHAAEDYMDQVIQNSYHRMLKNELTLGSNPAPITSPLTVVTDYNVNRNVGGAPFVPTGRGAGIENPVPQNNGTGNFTLPNGNEDQSSKRAADGDGNVLPGGGNVSRAGQGFGGGGRFGGGGGALGGGGQGFGGGGQGFGGGGQGPGGGGQGFGQGGQNQGQTGGATGLLPPGITADDISVLDSDNTLLIRYPDGPEGRQAVADLQKLIELLDVKPRQILLRAEFVTVSSNIVNGFGINWSFARGALIGGANTGFSTTNTAFLQYATGNIQTALSYILTSGAGRVVASPIATTMNNIPAVFFQTTNQPVFVSQPIVTPGGTTVISQFIIPIPVITAINILPRINGDDSLTLTGDLISSTVGEPIVSPDGSSFPSILSQSVPVRRIVRNGDTMVIAGLTAKNDTTSTNKVPLLGDLPIIGTLFRSRNTTTSDSELMVFITPTILEERPSKQATIGGSNLLAPGNAGPGSGGGVLPGGGN